MRFSTNNSAFLIHDVNTSVPSNLKKVFSTLVKRLPNHQKVAPVTTVKNDQKTVIKLVPKTSAMSKEDDVYRNLRNYYANERKRQSSVEDEQQKRNTERETRHKAVKQYQQSGQIKKSSASNHWREHSATSININMNAPPTYQTHHYVRDTRSNPDFLRIQAIVSNSPNKIIVNKQKPFLKKRQDDFVWGRPSHLRNVVTY